MNQIMQLLKKKQYIHIFFIVLVAFVSYSNSFFVPFHFDDNPNITENSLIRNTNFFIDPEKYCSQVSPVSDQKSICNAIKTRYIGYLTFGINYWIHGLHVIGYHIVNLIIHIVNALLIYYLIALTFRTPFLSEASFREHARLIALFSALIFVAHPVQTQAVTYIVQRFTSLATMFYLLSLVMYISARLKIDSGSRFLTVFARYFIAFISAVCAMKTKEISITLPFIITIYELFFLKGSRKKRFLFLVPILCTVFIIPLSLLNTDIPLGSIMNEMSEKSRDQTNMSRLDYLYTEIRVIVTYIRLLFLPIYQNLDYDYPVYQSFFELKVFLSFLFILVLLSSGIYLHYCYRNYAPQSRILTFGIFWFFIAISVESSIIPIVDVIFEHRVYLPSVGACIAIPTAVLWMANKYRQKTKNIGQLIIIALSCVILVFAVLTFARNSVWQDSVDLWKDVVSKSPNKIRGVYNLGKAYESANNLDKAIEMYEKVIHLDIRDFKAYNNLANIYSKTGQNIKALEYYTLAITIDPTYDLIYYNRGRLYLSLHQYNKAILDFTQAILINPYVERYFRNRGRAYAKQNQLGKAIEDFTIAINLNPNNSEVYALRGLAFQLIGKSMNALNDFQKSCSLGYQKACDALTTKR